MRTLSLKLDRFGLRSRLRLDPLSSQLNLVYGPNGSGKTTTIQFVRWLLYGDRDERTRRYISADSTPAAGSLRATHTGREWSIRREDDGTRQGQLSAVDQLDGSNSVDLQTLLGGVSPNEFDRLFVLNFGIPTDIGNVIESGLARGIDLVCQAPPDGRRRQLQLELQQLVDDLEKLPKPGADLCDLLQQRRNVREQLESAVTTHRQRHSEWAREHQRTVEAIERTESELHRLRDELHGIDSAIASRKERFEAVRRVVEQAKEDFFSQRRRELAELDADLDRWLTALEQIKEARRRRQADSDVYDACQPSEAPDDRVDQNEIMCPVNPVVQQIERLQNRLTQPTRFASTERSEGTLPDCPSGPEAECDNLRAELSALCDRLNVRRSSRQQRAIRGELSQLRVCQESINLLVDSLRQRRSDVASEIQAAERSGLWMSTVGAFQPHGERRIRTDVGGISLEELSVKPCSCSGWDPVDLPADARLDDLPGQRESTRRQIDECERELATLQQQRRQLEAQRQEPDTDSTIRRLQSEIERLELAIQAAEQRDRCERKIASLRTRLEKLTEEVRLPEVIEDASARLQRMTAGKYVRMRVTPNREVWLDAASSQALAYDQLSRGTQDQAYLCLCLALVAAYRRKGIELPLILNDAFVNIDSERDAATADSIREFARQGHQVILFTRHRHVVQLFGDHDVSFFDLRHLIVRKPESAAAKDSSNRRPAAIRSPMTRRVQPGKASAEFGSDYVIGKRRWNAEEFPGELTDKVKLRPQSMLPPGLSPDESPSSKAAATDTSSRPADVTLPASDMSRPRGTAKASSDDIFAGEVPASSGRDRRETIPDAAVRRQEGRRPEKVVPSDNSNVGLESEQEPSTVRFVRRFHLNISDPVVDAPSIGPKTAQRLAKIGIKTVADLLNANPERAAASLSHRRVRPETIRQWQAQANLACRIPRLRGHDAQVLVACNITEPEKLARMTADDLWRTVGPFVKTTAGRRLLRGAKSPDSNEVANWIRWAQEAKTVRAA